MIVGIILGVVAVLVIGGIVCVTMRSKRRQLNTEDLGPFHGTVIDRDHPAAKIMPFGSASRESPRYHNNPGSDMRIAIRRPDGGWDFADSGAPFTPQGVSELDVTPSPSSSRRYFPFSRRPVRNNELSKRELLRLSRTREPDLTDTSSVVGLPAYIPQSEGYLNQSKV